MSSGWRPRRRVATISRSGFDRCRIGRLWMGRLSPQTREQAVEWFQDLRSPQIPDNNGIWFQIIVETFLRGVGAEWDHRCSRMDGQRNSSGRDREGSAHRYRWAERGRTYVLTQAPRPSPSHLRWPSGRRHIAERELSCASRCQCVGRPCSRAYSRMRTYPIVHRAAALTRTSQLCAPTHSCRLI